MSTCLAIAAEIRSLHYNNARKALRLVGSEILYGSYGGTHGKPVL